MSGTQIGTPKTILEKYKANSQLYDEIFDREGDIRQTETVTHLSSEPICMADIR